MAEPAVAEPPQSAIALCDHRYNTRSLALADTAKKTYLTCYKMFLNWHTDNVNNTAYTVDTEDAEDGTLVYATQNNTDLFFYHHVPTNVKGTRDNVKKYLYAIQWFRTNLEKPLGAKIVESASVKTGIKRQQENSLAVAHITFSGVDPHKGLRDIMSNGDNLKIVKYIWQDRHDFADLMFCYTWGRNAGVRGGSARNLQLCDLNLSYGYGPENDPPRDRTLMVILRKGTRHKEKSTVDNQVGVQRHRDYRQCCVFATGILLIKLLRNLGDSIDFTQPNKNKDANWWGINVCSFRNLNAQSTPMREVYNKTGVDPQCKITHHRSQAVLIGASAGLNNSQIASFTKHVQDKLHTAYLPDCERTAMKVMAGFQIVSTILSIAVYLFIYSFVLTFLFSMKHAM